MDLMRKKSTKYLILLVVLFLTVALILKVIAHFKVAPNNQNPITTTAENIPPKPQYQQVSVTIKPHDTFVNIFKKLNLDPKDAHAILKLKDTESLRHLKPKQEMLFLLETDGSLHQISYQIDQLTVLTITNKKGFSAHITKLQPVSQLDYISSPIESSVSTSAKKLGLSSRIANQLANIFNEKINVSRNIKSGDRFAILYKNYYVNNKKIGEGDIEAAEIIHDNQVYRAVRFADPNGNADYYTPEGYTLKSPFVRYPIDHPKVTSRFSLHRWHPILQMYCAHLGVDLSAPAGTPIKATSSGKVIFAGIKANYGKTVIIQHNQYSTLYAHLSGFSQGIHSGTAVSRGQVIGRLGETGLATGPHVHYEFRIADKHFDPLKVKLPTGEAIAANYHKQFLAVANQMFAELDSKRHTLLAMHPGILR